MNVSPHSQINWSSIDTTEDLSFAEVQDAINSLTPSNVESVGKMVLDSVFISTTEGIKKIKRAVITASNLRPKSIRSIAAFVKFLLLCSSNQNDINNNNVNPNCLSQLKGELIRISASSYFDIWHLNFIHEAVKAKICTEEEVADEIAKYDNRYNNSFAMWVMLCWFAPILDKRAHELFVVNNIKIDNYYNTDYIAFAYFLEMYDYQKMNNWERFDEILEANFLPNSLGSIIKTDDIEKLQKYISANKQNFSVNKPVNMTIYNPSVILLNQPKLTQFAAFCGSIECLKYFLMNGAEVNDPNDGYTLMQFAIAGGNTEIIKLCEDYNATIEGAIQAASFYHQHSLFQYFYEKKNANIINDCVPPLMTVLHSAASTNNVREAIFCFEKKISPNIKDNDGKAPLHSAASFGSLDVISLLFKHPDINVNICDNKSHSPLMTAVVEGHPEVVDFFLKSGKVIDLNHINSDGQSALFLSVTESQIECVELLIEAPGVNLSVTDVSGNTILHITAREGMTKITSLILDHTDKNNDFDINQKNDEGNTPLHLAILTKCNSGIIDLLSNPKIDVNVKNSNGFAPIHYLCQLNIVEPLDFILKNSNLDVNAIDGEGNTALSIVCSEGNAESARLLLAHPKIDINKQNNRMLAPIHMATNNDEPLLLKILLENKEIKVNIQDDEGMTPLHFAAIDKSSECYRMLVERSDVDQTLLTSKGVSVEDIIKQNYQSTDNSDEEELDDGEKKEK